MTPNRDVTRGVRLDEPFDRVHEEPDISMDGQVGKDGRLGKLRLINVDHDPEGMVGEGRELVADLADVETASKDQRDVGVLQREVTGALANAARPSRVQRVLIPQQVSGVPRRTDGNAKAIDDPQEGAIRASMAERAAGKDDRALGQCKPSHGLPGHLDRVIPIERA